MQHIESRQNPRIKHLVKLRSRKDRDAHQAFLIEGERELSYALKRPGTLSELYFCTELFRNHDSAKLIDVAQELGIQLFEVTKSVFEKISYREGPDGLMGVGKQWSLELSDLELSQNPLLVIAEAIEKPGNLGSLIRSVEASGADALILTERVCDLFNPNTIRASQGLAFSLPVVMASNAAVLAFLKEKAIASIATTPIADTLYWDAPLAEPTAILMGSEADGLSAFWLDAADHMAKIPIAGHADSLNISTAAVLTLYEAIRQRNLAPLS